MSISSFAERFDKLNGELVGYAIKEGLSKEDAKDVVQEVGFNVFKRIINNQKLVARFEQNPDALKSYMYVALKNTISNYRNRKKPDFIEDKIKEEPRIDFEDPVIKSQRSDAVNRLFDEFEEDMLEGVEQQFWEKWLERVEKSGKANRSEISRELGLTPDQGHSILKKIKRKFQDFEARNSYLQDVAASTFIFDLGIVDFFKDIFKSDDEIDKELLEAGHRVSTKILDQLGLDAIAVLSKIIK